MTYYVYMLECRNGAFYTGYTTDLERRYQEHLAGSKKCKYTRSFPPKRIAASWVFETDLAFVLKVERFLKTLTKLQKLALVENPEQLDEMIRSKLLIGGEGKGN